MKYCRVNNLVSWNTLFNDSNVFGGRLCMVVGVLWINTWGSTWDLPYSCCGKCCYKNVSRVILDKHVRNHLEDKPWQCWICSHKICYYGYLALHMRGDTREGSHRCYNCGKYFAFGWQLTVHMVWYTYGYQMYVPGKWLVVCTSVAISAKPGYPPKETSSATYRPTRE